MPNQSMRSILVKLPNWIGDILFSYDLLFTLSHHFDRVGICTSTQHAELFDIFPIPGTEMIVYPPEDWPHLDRDLIRSIEKFRADTGLLLPNSFGSALILRFAGISHLVGYETEHRGFLLKKSIPKPRYRVHQTQYYLELLRLFDLVPLQYPIHTDRKGPLVILHPGASKIERAWHLDRFMKVAEALGKKGWEILFVSGEKIPGVPFRTLIKPSLKEFSGLLRKCSLFVGNDSGPLHLAQQCGAPVVGIYGPGYPLLTGPRPISPSRVVYRAFPCSPCRQRFFQECNPSPTNKPFCVETISTEDVLRAAFELL